jgi:hypothetical protein
VGVDDFGGVMRLKAPDPGDSPVSNPDIASKSRQPGPIDYHPIFDNGIEFGHVRAPFKVAKNRVYISISLTSHDRANGRWLSINRAKVEDESIRGILFPNRPAGAAWPPFGFPRERVPRDGREDLGL